MDKNENNQKKEEEEKETEIDSEKITAPLINVKSTVIFSASTINHFSFSIGLFLFMFLKFNWFHSKENRNDLQFYYYYLLFAGVIQYVIGFYDWYRGRTICFTLDFVFGLLYVAIYSSNYGKLFDFIVPTSDLNREGTFYALLAGLLLCFVVGSLKKGLLYLVDIIALFAGVVFLFIYYYWEFNWTLSVSKFIFLVDACLFWITGVCNLINDVFQKNIIPVLAPSI